MEKCAYSGCENPLKTSRYCAHHAAIRSRQSRECQRKNASSGKCVRCGRDARPSRMCQECRRKNAEEKRESRRRKHAERGTEPREPMPAETIHAMRTRRAEGKLLREIAAEFGVSVATVQRACYCVEKGKV